MAAGLRKAGAVSEQRFKDDLICGLISILQRRAPVQLNAFLKRMGFRDGDISFRTTKRGKYWTTIHRWPWEPRSTLTIDDVKAALDAGARERRAAEPALLARPGRRR